MSTALKAVLGGSGIIFCGYGGNDRSIAALLRSLPSGTFEWGTYWVGWPFPDGPVGQVLRERSEPTFLVPHGDFDSLMLQVADEFKLDLPPLVDRFKKLEASYARSLQSRSVAGPGPGSGDGDSGATGESTRATTDAAARMSGTMKAYSLLTEAEALKSDPDGADAAHRRAVEAAPSSALVLGNYAVFLQDVRKDSDAAEEHFRRALEAEPTHTTNLGNYAVFLQTVRKDTDGAEEYYRRRRRPTPTTLATWATMPPSSRTSARIPTEPRSTTGGAGG